jgi:hypothetical protein
MSEGVGWNGSSAQWMVTLQCCAPPGANGTAANGGGDDDSIFDFRGETVQEVLLTPLNQCDNRSIYVSGLTETPPKSPSTWTVGQIYNDATQTTTNVYGNVWGYDNNGFPPCAVEIYRCLRVTPCSAIVQQQMQIKSPADSGWTTYVTNELAISVDGFVIGNNEAKTSIGSIRSQRSDSSSPMYTPFSTNRYACPSWLRKLINSRVQMSVPCSL